jgi:uncharacterized lipoprotein YddW (UPF0748 family)
MAKFWVWVGQGPEETTDDEWQRRFDAWKEAGIDAVLPEVVFNGGARYGSDHLPVRARWMEQIFPLVQAAGLEFHCWMHMMCNTMEPIHDEHPEWWNVNREGKDSWNHPAYVDYYRFLCPSRPEVHAFLQKRLKELAAWDVDGLHIDYIRHPDVILASTLQPKYGIVQDREYPPYDYCYCEVCRAGFAETHGVDPLEMEDPTASEEWFQYRCDLITTLVNEHLIPVGRAAGKQMTAAVFPNWQNVRQQWGRWQLDHVLPMLYHPFYDEPIDWIGDRVREEIAFLEHGEPLSAGVMLGGMSDDDVRRMIEVSLEAGAAGVSFFSSGNLDEGKLAVIKAAARGA